MGCYEGNECHSSYSVTLLMVKTLWEKGCTWKGIIGSPVRMGLVCARVMCRFCSSVTAQRAWASPVPGTEAFMSEHHMVLRRLSDFDQWKTDEHIHSSCSTNFLFGCFLSHYQTQKITHCGYYFMLLFFLFPNSENRDLNRRSLLRPKSLEFTNSFVGDPAALTLSQPVVLTAGYFVLSNENSCSIFPLFFEEKLWPSSDSSSSKSLEWPLCSATHCLARAPVPWGPLLLQSNLYTILAWLYPFSPLLKMVTSDSCVSVKSTR